MGRRHLDHQEYSLAAIGDIIDKGQRAAWERLRIAALHDALIRERILKVCAARIHEPSAQGHLLWRHYVQLIRATS